MSNFKIIKNAREVEMTSKSKNQVQQSGCKIYTVSIDWLSVEKGGKKEIPEQGFYFCTTELLQEHQILTWS